MNRWKGVSKRRHRLHCRSCRSCGSSRYSEPGVSFDSMVIVEQYEYAPGHSLLFTHLRSARPLLGRITHHPRYFGLAIVRSIVNMPIHISFNTIDQLDSVSTCPQITPPVLSVPFVFLQPPSTFVLPRLTCRRLLASPLRDPNSVVLPQQP